MSQGEAMSENEATEGGVIFEELSTVRCYIVDGGSGSERACKAPGIFFFALCCLGKIPGGTPFSQLHKSGNGSRVDRP